MTKYEHKHFSVTLQIYDESMEIINQLCGLGWEVFHIDTLVFETPTKVLTVSTYYLRKEVE